MQYRNLEELKKRAELAADLAEKLAQINESAILFTKVKSLFNSALEICDEPENAYILFSRCIYVCNLLMGCADFATFSKTPDAGSFYTLFSRSMDEFERLEMYLKPFYDVVDLPAPPSHAIGAPITGQNATPSTSTKFTEEPPPEIVVPPEPRKWGRKIKDIGRGLELERRLKKIKQDCSCLASGCVTWDKKPDFVCPCWNELSRVPFALLKNADVHFTFHGHFEDMAITFYPFGSEEAFTFRKLRLIDRRYIQNLGEGSLFVVDNFVYPLNSHHIGKLSEVVGSFVYNKVKPAFFVLRGPKFPKFEAFCVLLEINAWYTLPPELHESVRTIILNDKRMPINLLKLEAETRFIEYERRVAEKQAKKR